MRRLIALAALGLAGLPALAPAASSDLPLGRRARPAVVPARSFAAARGQAVRDLRLLAYRDGAWKTVPFQLDCRGADNEFEVVPYQPLPDPAAPCGRADDNDELLFMARDAAGRAPGPPPGAVRTDEIILTGGQSETESYLYLAAYKQNPPPLSTTDYVAYRRTAGREIVESADYRLGYPLSNVFIFDLTVLPAAGGNGQDLMDRIKMRTMVESRAGLVTVDRTEDDFVTEVIGVRDGPVRVIRRTDTRLLIFLGIKTPAARVDAIYYADSFEVPSLMSMPFDMGLIARDVSYRQGFDLNRNALGMTFYSNNDPQGVKFDGRMDAREMALVENREENRWGLLSGPQGTFLYEGIWEPGAPMRKLLYYCDDPAALDSPEEDPGQVMFAYRFLDVLEIKDGAYRFNIVNWVFPDYPGGAQTALEFMQAPLTVKVGPKQ